MGYFSKFNGLFLFCALITLTSPSLLVKRNVPSDSLVTQIESDLQSLAASRFDLDFTLKQESAGEDDDDETFYKSDDFVVFQRKGNNDVGKEVIVLSSEEDKLKVGKTKRHFIVLKRLKASSKYYAVVVALLRDAGEDDKQGKEFDESGLKQFIEYLPFSTHLIPHGSLSDVKTQACVGSIVFPCGFHQRISSSVYLNTSSSFPPLSDVFAPKKISKDEVQQITALEIVGPGGPDSSSADYYDCIRDLDIIPEIGSGREKRQLITMIGGIGGLIAVVTAVLGVIGAGMGVLGGIIAAVPAFIGLITTLIGVVTSMVKAAMEIGKMLVDVTKDRDEDEKDKIVMPTLPTLPDINGTTPKIDISDEYDNYKLKDFYTGHADFKDTGGDEESTIIRGRSMDYTSTYVTQRNELYYADECTHVRKIGPGFLKNVKTRNDLMWNYLKAIKLECNPSSQSTVTNAFATRLATASVSKRIFEVNGNHDLMLKPKLDTNERNTLQMATELQAYSSAFLQKFEEGWNKKATFDLGHKTNLELSQNTYFNVQFGLQYIKAAREKAYPHFFKLVRALIANFKSVFTKAQEDYDKLSNYCVGCERQKLIKLNDKSYLTCFNLFTLKGLGNVLKNKDSDVFKTFEDFCVQNAESVKVIANLLQ